MTKIAKVTKIQIVHTSNDPVKPRGIITLEELSDSELSEILIASVRLRLLITPGRFQTDVLKGHSVALLFFEASTRTRFSFELAAKLLGAQVLNFSESTTSVKKGETLKDTAYTLSHMGISMSVIRHPHPGSADEYMLYTGRPVLNGGDGAHAHPTQALLDYASIGALNQEMLPDSSGAVQIQKHIAIVGDIAHSRVARSNLYLWARLGHQVTLVGPQTLLPQPIDQYIKEVDKGRNLVFWSNDLDEIIPEVDYLMMLRVQLERISEPIMPSGREYVTRFGLNRDRLDRLQPTATILHPGPVNRDVEVCEDVYTDKRCIINEQVGYGTSVRMVCLAFLAGRLKQLQDYIEQNSKVVLT